MPRGEPDAALSLADEKRLLKRLKNAGNAVQAVFDVRICQPHGGRKCRLPTSRAQDYGRKITVDTFSVPGSDHARPVNTKAAVIVKCNLNDAHINIAKRMVAKYGMPLGPVEMNMFRKMDPTLPPPIALTKWAASFEPPSTDEGFAVVDRIPFKRRVDPEHKQKGLLLDVDGTLRKTRSGNFYPKHPDDVQLLPKRTKVLKKWHAAGYKLFFVSNQSGVASMQVSHDAVQSAFHRTQQLLGVPIEEIVYCPHPHRPVGCFCRKPMPGLGVYLMERHQLAPEHLVMVGDRETDEGFARAIGATYFDAHEFFQANGPELLD